MDGSVRLTFEREPCFWHASAVAGERSRTVVARTGGEVVGLATRSVGAAFVDGERRSIGYLSQLRIEGGRRATIARLAAGFRRLEEERRPGELEFDFTTVLAENRVARRLLEAGLESLPSYTPIAELSTVTVSCSDPPWRRVRPAPFDIAPVRPEELEEVTVLLDQTRADLQLAPTWSLSELASPVRSRGLTAERFFWASRDGRRFGCAALWSQSAFKQVVVRGYSKKLHRWRGALNGLAALTGSPRLPPTGSPLRLGYLSHVAAPVGDGELFCALIDAARLAARRLGLDLLSFGLDSRRPELGLVRKRYRSQETNSVVYLVCARANAASVDGFDGDRYVHPEVALL